MTSSALALLKTRRFAPLFAGLCIGAFGDNVFRNALVMLVQFRLAADVGLEAAPLIALAPAIFILPYFLFSITAGQLADKLDKAVLIQRLKLLEIGLMIAAAYALVFGHIPSMFVILFLAGMQSAFYSPVKLAILPQHLQLDELLTGNALAGAGVFLSILIGTILGGTLVLMPYGTETVGTIMIVTAVIGWLTAQQIPAAPPVVTDVEISRNPFADMRSAVQQAFAQKGLPLVILGHSAFWFLATLLVGQMPAMVKETLQGSPAIFTFVFTLFSIGVGAGAMLTRRLLGTLIDGRYSAFSALGLAVSIVMLSVTLMRYHPSTTEMSLALFLSTLDGWLISAEMLIIALFAGIYIVPLNALLQSRAAEALRARTISVANLLDSVAVVLAGVIAALLLMSGLSIPSLWLLLGLACFALLPVIMALVPHLILKRILQRTLMMFYDVNIEGLEHIPPEGQKAVIVANHVSLLDGLLLAAFLPHRPLFAVNAFIATRWWVKPFLSLVETYEMDPTKPMAIKGLIARVDAGAQCVIFPEGRITTTGSLMKIHEGSGLIADKAKAPIIPVRIAGAEYTPLSYLGGMVRRRLFPRIRLVVQAPQHFTLAEGLSARERRAQAGQKLYDVMSNLMFATSFKSETLTEAFLTARAIHGGAHPVLEDVQRQPLSYNQVLLRALLLGRQFKRFSDNDGRIGLMLPNTNAAVISFLGLHFYGRVPAMLNFTAGLANLKSACAAATLTHVITSRRFITEAKLEALAEGLSQQLTLIYLEDIAKTLHIAHKLRALCERMIARMIHRYHAPQSADEPAVILFTSGSEGSPKGVVLSHNNLLANRWQVGARIDFSPRDIVLNALPLFHSFGLTGGLLIPMLAGAKVMVYPSPLHYRIIPMLAYDCNATILFGTDTFLAGYARMAHPYDFHTVRFVCAGAEKVKDETRRQYAERFGVRILEGYGATETAPVIALNTLLHSKAGTVGRLLPAMKARLVPIAGIEGAGRLFVSGPNIMKGYLRVENAGVIEPPEKDTEGAWHDTGDIVAIDYEGYLSIKGRAKRFAKIAGEMIALGAVEDLAARIWPSFTHAVVSLPDVRKGEQLILVTTHKDPSIEAILRAAKEFGHTELMVPKTFLVFDALPLLGTGKIDYVELLNLVKLKLRPAVD